MILKTYNPADLSEKRTFSKLTSVIFTSRFYRPGSFEIHTETKGFEINDIIAFKSYGRINSGIIMKISERDAEYVITGYDLKGVYEMRHISFPAQYTGTPSQIMEALATEFLAVDGRALPGILIEVSEIDGDSIVYTPDKEYLSKSFETFGLLHEVGTRLDFNLQNIVFSAVKGVDRSQLIKFSRKNRTIESYELVNDIFNTYNVGYSTDENGTETVTGNATGFLRRECFKDKNIEEYLAEKAEIATLRGEANEKYVYGKDYELGDYVTVMTDEVQTVKQITEVKEVYEHGRSMIIPVFGTEKENPLKRILKGE